MSKHKIPFDLSTAEGRKIAEDDYWWQDHAFLRVNFQNAHKVGDKLWRSNQPSPEQLAVWQQKGIKTIINLRGDDEQSHTVLEKDACAKLGLDLKILWVESRAAPRQHIMNEALTLFDSIEYPALIHCKSGADRAGLIATLYALVKLGQPMEQAMEQLSFKYLHIAAAKTGILDEFCRRFAAAHQASGIGFADWLNNEYDREALVNEYKPQAAFAWFVDNVLRRE